MVVRAARLCAFGAGIAGCGSPPVNPEALIAAMRAVEANPDAAEAHCAALPAGPHRGDCIVAAVEKLAATRPAEAEALCLGLGDAGGVAAQQECWFQLAERSKDAGICARAGSFADDCRIHVWTAVVPGLVAALAPRDPWEPATVDTLRTAATDLGFDADDHRVWTVVFRHLHHRSGAPATSACAGVPQQLATWCAEAALGVYRDQLRFLRDSARFPCTEAPAATDDPDGRLRAIHTQLAAEAGCTP